MDTLKRTPLHSRHLALGARMTPFAGYHMPLEYSGIMDEHRAVRAGMGLFDVSHMGRIWVRGPQAAGLVQRITTNDAQALTPGGVQYSCLTTPEGGILDDLLVYLIAPSEYLLVVNAANTARDWAWICQQGAALGMAPGHELHNATDAMAQLAVQGPLALRALGQLTGAPIGAMPPFRSATIALAGIPGVILSTTGYTGAGGCEVYCPSHHALALWDALLGAGQAYGARPVGLGARDTLRLEMGYCLWGQDMDHTTTPLEAGLGWITRLTAGNDFVGRAAVEAQRARGIPRRLVGLRMIDRGIPRAGYPILSPSGEPIGRVTSGGQSPTLGVGIGLGYVPMRHAQPQSEVRIGVRGRPLRARVVKPPFVGAE